MYMGDCNVYQILKNLGYDIDGRIREINEQVAKWKEEDKANKKTNENQHPEIQLPDL